MVIATRETRRRRKGGIGQETAALLALLALFGLVLAVWGALVLGSHLAGMPATMHPVGALLELAAGRRPWPWQSSVIAAGFATSVSVVVVAVWRRRRGRSWIDAAARTMTPARSLTMGRREHIEAANTRLLADAENIANPLGPRLGHTVDGHTPVHVPAEIGVTCIAGTRTGKTMAWAIPAVLDAWGPVVATSNKPDLYRHTRFGREGADPGARIWVCDLQAVTGRAWSSFWWNPLRPVRSLAHARRLAGFFVAASREPGARQDAYFDPEAQELLALYLYAAALAGGDLLHTAEWLGNDQDTTPRIVLQHFGEPDASRRIRETQALTARQRDGVYGMARRFLNVMTATSYAAVATPPVRQRITANTDTDGITIEVVPAEGPARHQLPEFDPHDFVISRDTLYPLSMEGADSAAPLMTALVGQILDAALATARARPDGRLAVPLLAVLDEAANCCKLGELPHYYTYSGGHGVILMTFLQVLEQGEQMWGEHGLNTMRAQSIEIYGGGIGDTTYLRQWSSLVGPHDVADRSRRVGHGGVDRTLQWHSEPILDEAQLAAMPIDRALVRYPGNGPILVRKIPWPATEHATSVTESLRRYGSPPTSVDLTKPGQDEA